MYKLTACALYLVHTVRKIVFCFLKKWFGAWGTEQDGRGEIGKGEEEEQNKQEFIKQSGGREGDREESARLLLLPAEQTRVYKAIINILKGDRVKQFLFLKRKCSSFECWKTYRDQTDPLGGMGDHRLYYISYYCKKKTKRAGTGFGWEIWIPSNWQRSGWSVGSLGSDA
jgi:hypothetical protein